MFNLKVSFVCIRLQDVLRFKPFAKEHFQGPLNSVSKLVLVQNISNENEFYLPMRSPQNQIHLDVNDIAPGLVFKQRPKLL